MGRDVAHASHKTQNLVNNMISDYGLSDIFHLAVRIGYSLKLINSMEQQLAFTFLFINRSDNLVNFPICTSDIGLDYSSDHSYVSLNIQGSTIVQGKGYWKFNNSHLLNNDFVNDITCIVVKTFLADKIFGGQNFWRTVRQFARTRAEFAANCRSPRKLRHCSLKKIRCELLANTGGVRAGSRRTTVRRIYCRYFYTF